MTPAEITAHLSQRFKLLTRGRRTASTRQQTLRNTIDWSYELLENPERQVFRRLAVFAGEFGLEAAESVVPDDGVETFDVVDLLGRLVEKSLVLAESVSGSTRYRLLETMRDYAWERLEEAGELDDVAGRHAQYFLGFARRADPGLESPDETLWRSRVEQELENLRTALRWFISTGDAESALAEIYAFANVGSLNYMPFGMLALEASDLPAATDHPLRAVALSCVAMSLAQEGHLQESITYVDRADSALAALEDTPESYKIRCRIRGCITTPVAYEGDSERLLTLSVNGLRDARRSNDKLEEMRSLIMMCSILGDEREAIRAGEEAFGLALELQVPTYLAWAPMMLATRLTSVDPPRAEALLDQAVEAATKINHPWALYMADQSLAMVQAVQGFYDSAACTILRSAERSHLHGAPSADDGATWNSFGPLACLLASTGAEDAALLTGIWAELHGYHADRHTNIDPAYRAFGVDSYLDLRASQGSEEIDRLTHRARAMSVAEILALVHRSLYEDD